MNVVLQASSARFNVLLRYFLKASFIMVICLVSTSRASAQHCEDCNVNIFGEELVRVGETHTYFITPRLPNTPYTPIWDYNGYLSAYATIVDQGLDAFGHEYIKLNFYASGWTWLSYDGLYSGITEDYDEMNLHILP